MLLDCPKTMKNRPSDSSLSDTSHAVDVVPMFAPSRMPRLDLKEMVLASTKATASAVTALLD